MTKIKKDFLPEDLIGILANNKIDGCIAVQADQSDLRTIESVANDDGSLHPIQQAFHDCHALQWGYCTPGMIMNIVSAFENNEKIDTSDEGIRELISGNICRCTGYANIIEAVREAADKLHKKQ